MAVSLNADPWSLCCRAGTLVFMYVFCRNSIILAVLSICLVGTLEL